MSIKKLIEAIEKKKPLPEFSILDAIQILDVTLAVYNRKFFSEGTTANDILSVDNSFTSTETLMTDDAILCDFLNEEGSETEDNIDDVSNEPI